MTTAEFVEEYSRVNPPRAEGPVPHYSRGRNLHSQRYLVGWEDGIVKVGSTSHGRQRWGKFLNRGGTMLDLAYYADLSDDLRGEMWLERQIRNQYPPAFQHKEQSLPYLGPSGGGYLECFAVPVEDWPKIIELARTEDALV